MPHAAKNTELQTLIALTAQGDKPAFYQLYTACSSYLNGVAIRIVGTEDASNDVLQDAFVQIWNNAQQYNPSLAQPLTWLTSIVRYRALDRLAKDKRRAQTFVHAEEEATCDNGPWATLLKEQYKHQLHHCLSQLNDNQASSVKMAYLQGYSREEIAEHLGTKINTVKSWLRRAQEKLKQCLIQYV